VPPAEGDQLMIKWAAPVAAAITRTTPKGIVVPVCKLWQRLHRRMESGRTMELSNLLYTDGLGEARDLSIARLGPGAVLIKGEDPTLLAIRGAKIRGVSFDAEMVFVSPTRVAWTHGTTLRVGEMRLLTGEPCDLELDVRSGALLPKALTGDVRGGLAGNVVRAFLERLPRITVVETRAAREAQPAAQAWECRLSAGPVRRIRGVDIDGDGKPEVLVAAGSSALVFSRDGAPVWAHTINGVCHDVDAGELDPSPGKETVVGGGDAFVHVLDSRGHLLRKAEVRGAAWNANFGNRPWAVYTVAVADLDGDGRAEIVAGMQSFELRLYSPQLRELSRVRKTVLHGSIDFHIADADGDGKREIFATDHYGHLTAYDHTGERLLSLYSSIGDMQAVIDDLDADGVSELVYGSSTGDLRCASPPRAKPWARKTKVAWRFDNYGYAVNRLRAADIDGDGAKEVIVASQTGYVYVLDGKGREKWRRQVGMDVVEVLVLGKGAWQLACFDRQGTATFVTGDGKRHRTLRLGFEPSVAELVDDLIVVGGRRTLAAFRPPGPAGPAGGG